MKIYDNSEIRTRAPEDQMEVRLIPDSGALDRSAMLPYSNACSSGHVEII